MKINEDNEPLPGDPLHFWGLMSYGDELPEVFPDY